MRRKLEVNEQNKTIATLTRLGAKVIKIHVDGYTVEGTPDLIGCYRGQAFAFECKMEGEVPSEKQKYEMRKWSEAGAIVAVIYKVQDALDALGIG